MEWVGVEGAEEAEVEGVGCWFRDEDREVAGCGGGIYHFVYCWWCGLGMR
jgi:hypothetical protein